MLREPVFEPSSTKHHRSYGRVKVLSCAGLESAFCLFRNRIILPLHKISVKPVVYRQISSDFVDFINVRDMFRIVVII